MNEKPNLKIVLTTEQQAQVRQATGKEVTSLKLMTLEHRLAPGLSRQ